MVGAVRQGGTSSSRGRTVNPRAAAVGWSLAVVLVTGALVLAVANVVLGDRDIAVTAAELFSKVVNLFAMLAFASVGALVVARRRAVGETMQPAHVSLWLYEPERVR